MEGAFKIRYLFEKTLKIYKFQNSEYICSFVFGPQITQQKSRNFFSMMKFA
jgi:hypothetical protein